MLDALSRRQLLLDEMNALNERGVNCYNCPGHCCTSVANSMMVTPWETADVMGHLRAHNLLTDELKLQLQENVRKFRLDVPMPGNGRRGYLRRTYDCPFFAGSNLGCTIPKEVKPYGCLGFNPTLPNESEGKSCGSNQDILKRREAQAPDDSGEKFPLPVALLMAWDSWTTGT